MPWKGVSIPIRLDLFSRLFWNTIFLISIVLLGFRIYFAFTNGVSSTNITIIQVVIIGFLTYVLFVLEGLIVSAIQIKRLDQEAIDRHIDAEYKESANKLRSIISTLKNHFDDFIVGRQLLVIITVVALAFTIDGLAFDQKHALFAWLDLHRAGSGTVAFEIFKFWGTTFLISTLLPCWIAQLLPQFLAEERGVEFVKRPLAKTLTWLSLRISKLGAGAPSHGFFWLIRRLTGRFSSEEKIGVGSAQVFDAQSSYLGFGIRERLIIIEAGQDETTIDDSSIYEFISGNTSHLRHFVKIYLAPEENGDLQAGGAFTTKFAFPNEVLGSKPTTRVVQVVTSELTRTDAAVRQEKLTQSVVVSSQTTVNQALPRKGLRDNVTMSLAYKWPPLKTAGESTDDFVFDVTRPTRQIRFEIKPAPGTFITEPTLRFILADELPFRQGSRSLSGVVVDPEQLATGWRLTARFPPSGSCAILQINAHVLEPATPNTTRVSQQ
jgi:hypothetical protein